MFFRILLSTMLIFSGCDYPVNSGFVTGAAGSAGKHTAVERDTEGNMLGYYEYLPRFFLPDSGALYPLVFYWNGKNAISGNGRSDLNGLLHQGLPEYINKGKHYPAVIISAQMKYADWETINVHPFVDYILKRYKQNIDINRIYMTGFSAGGGLTMRYADSNPDVLAAIVPVSPAVRYPDDNDPSNALKNVKSWIFHNKGDDVVKSARSIRWYQVLNDGSDKHRLTIYTKEGHYAWYQVYDDPNMWNWLLAQNKNIK